jgi:hypothetical protein
MNVFSWITWIWNWIMSWRKPKPPPQLMYESYYPLNTLKETLQETTDNIQKEQVEEETPEGKVIMKYNKDDNFFFYWSEKPQMYRYLETVARKYVILYDCKDVYVNMYKELLKSLQEKEPMIQGPYAKFKSYNTSSTTHIKHTLTRERANKYKYMGKKQEVQQTPIPFKPINFLEYKNKNV